MSTTITVSDTELAAAVSFRGLLAARRLATAAHHNARIAADEATALQAALERAEAEYRNLTRSAA